MPWEIFDTEKSGKEMSLIQVVKCINGLLMCQYIWNWGIKSIKFKIPSNLYWREDAGDARDVVLISTAQNYASVNSNCPNSQ